MHELIQRIIDDLRGSWRFRWWALAAAWAVCVAGWLYVSSMPNVYRATARVYVDTSSALRPLLHGLAVEPDVESNLAIVRQAILSRPQLEKVARESDLDLRAKTPQAMEGLVTSLRSRITIDADSRSRNSPTDGLYRISFLDNSREKSLEVVQLLLESFVEDTLGSKRTGQEGAQRFLEAQIKEYESRLTQAEERVSEFKKRNVGQMPDSRGDYFVRMQAEMNELETTKRSLGLAETRRDEMQRQINGEEPFLFGFDPATSGGADQGGGDVANRIRENERRLEELQLRFTDKHPEVIAVRNTITALKEQQAAEVARLKSGQRGTGQLSQSLKANPVYQSIQVELKRTDVQIAELRQDVAQRQTRVNELRRLVDTVPEVEAELARLNRDYDVTRAQYQQLAQRLETAKLSEEADRTGIVKFDVLDPPAVPTAPESPNRPVLLAGVFILALGFGVGLAYALNLVRPVFQSVSSLADITGLPVLGAISRTWGAKHAAEARRSTLAFYGAAGLLVVTFAAVLVLRNSSLIARLGS
jgi:polysaccharide chain length determinant protein (PEP-CTERM system associated)